MTESIITRTYTFEEEDTCKYGWTFTIMNSSKGWIIENVQVEEREIPRGCSGHPKTLGILLKGRALDSFPLEGLLEASCDRSLSCGQALAQCITDLSAELG